MSWNANQFFLNISVKKYEHRQTATRDMRILILKHIYKTGIEFQYENESFQV